MEGTLTMHQNEVLLRQLFEALNRHDPAAMGACYLDDATFEDIAFRLKRRRRIEEMWRMVCANETLEARVAAIDANDTVGRVSLVDDYKFGKQRKPVINVIESHFRFRNGKIVEQVDVCDPRVWAQQALGTGPLGWLAGRFRPVRSFLAGVKLWRFTRAHA
jgi:ketosteroid isomerase-like protein